MPFPISLTDARGRRVRLERPPRRVVSLVPSQTELLAHLGLDDEVVGLTRFCVHPEGWKQEKRIVGGTKNVLLERVEELAPDLVLANLEENTREDVEALEEQGPVFVTHVENVEGAFGMIAAVGRLVGRSPQADTLVARLRSAFMELPHFPPLPTAYLIWREPYMTVGHDTIIHDVMRRAGLVNVFGSHARYPELTAEDLRAAAPELVLLSSEPYPFAEKHRSELRAVLPASDVRLVDGEPFSWYGSRLLETPPYLRELREAVG